jgi:hypothetical protein
MRDHAHTLSDFRVPTLSIECEPCGRRDRYNVAKLIEPYGDMKLPDLRHVLANCPKARSFQHLRPVQGQARRGQPVLMIARWPASLGDRHSPPVGFSRLGLFARGPWRP